MKPDELDPIEIIRAEARAVAQCFGIAAADEAAASMVERLQARLAGVSVYIPARSSQDRERVRVEILARYDGTNVGQLAREFDLTQRGVRKLIARSRCR